IAGGKLKAPPPILILKLIATPQVVEYHRSLYSTTCGVAIIFRYFPVIALPGIALPGIALRLIARLFEFIPFGDIATIGFLNILLQLKPIIAGTHFDQQRHTERMDILHLMPD